MSCHPERPDPELVEGAWSRRTCGCFFFSRIAIQSCRINSFCYRLPRPVILAFVVAFACHPGRSEAQSKDLRLLLLLLLLVILGGVDRGPQEAIFAFWGGTTGAFKKRFLLFGVERQVCVAGAGERSRGPQRQVFVAGVGSRRTCISFFFGKGGIPSLLQKANLAIHFLCRTAEPALSEVERCLQIISHTARTI